MGGARVNPPVHERMLLHNGEVVRDGNKYRVTYPRAKNPGTVKQNYDFSSHPLRELVRRFIFGEAEGLSAGTMNAKCRCLKDLGDFMSQAGHNDLNPEVISSYSKWLFGEKDKDGGPRFTETCVAPRLTQAVALYEFGLTTGQPGWSQRDLDTIRAAANKSTRGRCARGLQKSVDEALSLKTYSDLARALTLEFEQCKRVLEARDSGERQSLYNVGANTMGAIDPNPFVVFALQAAMRLGLRASELNSLNADDVRRDDAGGNHELYVHAPDKSDDFIPVDETFLAALEVCSEWSKEAREAAGDEGVGWHEKALLVYRPTSTCYGRPLFQLSTYYLNSSHLKYFYEKWFNQTVRDENGTERPLLHAENDPTRPLWVDYRKLRNSFAIRFAERETSRVLVKRVMRHRSIATAEKHYLHKARLDHAKKVQIALKAEARLLTMGLVNAVGVGISEDTLRDAREKGAITPHGICGAGMEGRTCDRANDCLECPHLVVIVSRRPRLVADREAYLELAKGLDARGDLRGAENALGRAKLCQAQVLRIDEVACGDPN